MMYLNLSKISKSQAKKSLVFTVNAELKYMIQSQKLIELILHQKIRTRIFWNIIFSTISFYTHQILLFEFVRSTNKSVLKSFLNFSVYSFDSKL